MRPSLARAILLILAVTTATLLASSPGAAYAQAPYTFTLVAEEFSPNNQEGYLPGFGVNANGTVAFSGCLGASPAKRCGVYTGRGGTVSLIAGLTAFEPAGRIEAGPFFSVSLPALNKAGAVAFYGCHRDRGCGLFLGRDDAPRLIVPERPPWTSVGGPVSFLLSPGISDLGVVAFYGCHERKGCGIYRTLGGLFAQAAAEALTPLWHFGMNGAGTIVYQTCDAAGCRVLTNHGAITTLVANVTPPSDTFRLGPNPPAIDESGNVTYLSCLDADCAEDWGIFLSRPGRPTTSIVDRATFGGAVLGPTIGAAHVVFFGCMGSSVDPCGLFRGPDPLVDGILVEGDQLFGATVSSICCWDATASFVLEHEDMNEKGQLAIWAQLSDGRSVIVRADPVRRRR